MARLSADANSAQPCRDLGKSRTKTRLACRENLMRKAGNSYSNNTPADVVVLLVRTSTYLLQTLPALPSFRHSMKNANWMKAYPVSLPGMRFSFQPAAQLLSTKQTPSAKSPARRVASTCPGKIASGIFESFIDIEHASGDTHAEANLDARILRHSVERVAINR